jgi:hypothetical protein
MEFGPDISPILRKKAIVRKYRKKIKNLKQYYNDTKTECTNFCRYLKKKTKMGIEISEKEMRRYKRLRATQDTIRDTRNMVKEILEEKRKIVDRLIAEFDKHPFIIASRERNTSVCTRRVNFNSEVMTRVFS